MCEYDSFTFFKQNKKKTNKQKPVTFNALNLYVYFVGFYFFSITCNCCEIGLPKTRMAVFDIPFEKYRIIPFEPKNFDRIDAIVLRPDGMSNRKKYIYFSCLLSP